MRPSSLPSSLPPLPPLHLPFLLTSPSSPHRCSCYPSSSPSFPPSLLPPPFSGSTQTIVAPLPPSLPPSSSSGRRGSRHLLGGGEEERGKQGGSRGTNEPKADRMLLQASRATCVGGREGGKEGGRGESFTHSCCIASALPPSLPSFVPLPSNTTRGPCQCNAWGGAVGAGKRNSAHDP